jgi:hypothetical protein
MLCGDRLAAGEDYLATVDGEVESCLEFRFEGVRFCHIDDVLVLRPQQQAVEVRDMTNRDSEDRVQFHGHLVFNHADQLRLAQPRLGD